jgi:hypothetical protein
MIIDKWRIVGAAGKRYVRKSAQGDGYDWCERSVIVPRYDVARGTCDASDLPVTLRLACDTQGARYFYACEWPL